MRLVLTICCAALLTALAGCETFRWGMFRRDEGPAAGPVPTKKVPDPTLLVGQKVVDSTGEPPRTTSVRRIVYDVAGKVLHDTIFYSSYRGEPTVIRVGTKPRPQTDTATTTTTTTTTTTATTATTTKKPPPRTTSQP